MGHKKSTETEAMLWYTYNMKEDYDQNGLKIALPENTNYYYEKRFLRLYRSCLADMMQISGCARHLLDWLCEIMGSTNIVNNNVLTRQNFIGVHKKASGKEYSDDAVIKAYKQLSEVRFLIPYKRGLFVVNPEYFFNGDEIDRKKLIRLTLEFRAGVRTEIDINSK